MRHALLVLWLFCASAPSVVAQLSLSNFFTNNMVLQRNKPIHIWGKGTPGKSLAVQFGKETITTTIREDSTWSVFLKKRKANTTPQSIHIASNQQKMVLTNVVIGDLWLCIGQSNMEWPMAKEMHFKQEIKNAGQPLLRFYNPEYAGKNIYNESFNDSVLRLLNTKDFNQGRWEVSDSNTVKQMSAVAYYFGKEIFEKEHIPIGLFNMAIGGAPIDSFISRDCMEEDSLFSSKVKGNWLHNDALPVWIRERGKQNVGDIQVIHKDELGPNACI